MVLRIIKGIMGAGVTVDTVIANTEITPGGDFSGEVKFTGGEVDQLVEGITLEFTALVEEDAKGENKVATYHYFRSQVSGPFQLAPASAHSVPFEFQVPWETPINSVGGRPLTGMKLGVSTELALDKAFDKSDLDPLVVEPLPVQAEAMRAIESLGFVLQGADLEQGTVSGSHMPFYQEIEYWSNGEFSSAFKELEATFITNATTTDIILQAGNSGPLTAGNDNHQRFTVQNNVPTDLTEPIRTQIQQLAQRQGLAG